MHEKSLHGSWCLSLVYTYMWGPTVCPVEKTGTSNRTTPENEMPTLPWGSFPPVVQTSRPHPPGANPIFWGSGNLTFRLPRSPGAKILSFNWRRRGAFFSGDVQSRRGYKKTQTRFQPLDFLENRKIPMKFLKGPLQFLSSPGYPR